MQINISLPFIFNIYLVITFIHIILTAVADPDVNLPKVEFTSKKQTKGPEDPENAGKNIFWTAKDDNAKADPYWQREQRFIFKENRHEVKIFVPVDKEQSSRDVHMRITEKYLQCGFENGTIAIAGDLMEPIQTQHSFWDFISPSELDDTDNDESINEPHVYIFLVKKYDTNANWNQLYKFIPKVHTSEVIEDDESIEEEEEEKEDEDASDVDESFGEDEDEENIVASSTIDNNIAEEDSSSRKLPPLPPLIQLTRKLDVQALQKHFEEAKKNDILDANVKDEKQRTPLMWLASDYSSSKHRDGTQYQYISGKMVSICHMLIDAGADPYATDFYGMTALHWAAASGWHDLVAVLLAQDETYENDYANIQDILNGSTPLIVASANGHEKVVATLAHRKADLNVRQKSEKGWTALMIAAYNGHVIVVDKLLHAGATFELLEFTSGRTICHIAAAQGHAKVIEMLVSYDACDLNLLSKKDRVTPYALANKIGHENAANVLREAKVRLIEKRHEEWTKRQDENFNVDL